MEIRARYVLMGLFSLAVILAGFGFVYWLENVGGLSERSIYRIRFDSSVSGLLLGSAVQFNGIRVGEVTDLSLNPEDPRQVIVTVSILKDTPVRTDTAVGLIFGGLTGVPEIALSGGTPAAPQPQASRAEPPLLVAETGASMDWTAAAREAFVRIDTLLSDNSEALTETIANLDTFSEALARNSESFDDIIAGLARLAGARAGGKMQVFYDLSAATDFAPIANTPPGQLVVNQPIVAAAYDTQQFIVRSADGSQPAFEGAGWSDTLPRLAQAAIIRSFENAGYSRVGRDFQGLAADYTLTIDMDTFHIAAETTAKAEVGFSATIVDRDGSIIAARRFEASTPMTALQAEEAAHAFDAAFRETAGALVAWALNVVGDS